MSEIRWVKLSTQMFDDEKIKVIETMPSGGDICLIWVKLIVLAGRTNDDGAVYLTKNLPYTPDMLARIFSKPVETIRMALDTFVKLEMVEIDKDSIIVLVNWEKYQNIEGMDRIRQLTADRVRKSREKRKLLECNVTRSATVTEGNAIDLDLDSELDSDKDKIAPKRSTASAPKPVSYDFTTGLFSGVTDEMVATWQAACPAVSVDREIVKAAQWLLANPNKRKKNYRRFLLNWIMRAQERGKG